MSSYEVEQPILCSPFEEPTEHWEIEEGGPSERKTGRREAGYYYRDPRLPGSADEHDARGQWQKLDLVEQIRKAVRAWRAARWSGASGTTIELLEYWRREGRLHRLFFAQIEAAETVIFLTEARPDFLQGIDVPTDEPSEERRREGYRAFRRYACKMATGTGKTTVMGMLAAWSILNKVHDRANGSFSDVVRSHVNAVVADTDRWEQSAAYSIDTHPLTDAFVKNAGLGFAIPYLHNGQPHDYMPDFIIRMTGTPERYVILETKGYDELEHVKAQAAERWIAAVNADGRYGEWRYAIARKPTEVAGCIAGVLSEHCQINSSRIIGRRAQGSLPSGTRASMSGGTAAPPQGRHRGPSHPTALPAAPTSPRPAPCPAFAVAPHAALPSRDASRHGRATRRPQPTGPSRT